MALKIPVTCSGEAHTVIVTDDLTVLILDHDLEAEQIAVHLGGDMPECFRLKDDAVKSLSYFLVNNALTSYADHVLVAVALLRDAFEEIPKFLAHEHLPPGQPFEYHIYLRILDVAKKYAHGRATDTHIQGALRDLRQAWGRYFPEDIDDYQGDNPMALLIFTLKHSLLKPISQGRYPQNDWIFKRSRSFFRDWAFWLCGHEFMGAPPPALRAAFLRGTLGLPTILELDRRQARIIMDVLNMERVA